VRWASGHIAPDVRYAVHTVMINRCEADAAVTPKGDEAMQINEAGVFDCDVRCYELTDAYAPCLAQSYLDYHLLVVNHLLA
jgi:hypothetical protein